MVNPQKENGYTAIANEIMDALIKYRIPGEQRQCLDFIIRKTYGYNKKRDMISNSQFVKKTGLKKGNVSRAIKALVDKKLVIKSDNKDIPTYRFNKNYQQWKVLSKKITLSKVITGVIKSDNKPLSKMMDTKDNKDNITKDSVYYPSWLNLSLWREFKKMRIKIKKPMTPFAEKLRIKDLKKLIDKGYSQDEIVNKSISSCWQDFYEPNKPKPNKNSSDAFAV